MCYDSVFCPSVISFFFWLKTQWATKIAEWNTPCKDPNEIFFFWAFQVQKKEEIVTATVFLVLFT